jgi:hypothetical protein
MFEVSLKHSDRIRHSADMVVAIVEVPAMAKTAVILDMAQPLRPLLMLLGQLLLAKTMQHNMPNTMLQMDNKILMQLMVDMPTTLPTVSIV